MRATTIGRPRVGVSACLLGERVRYDGGHKRDRYLAQTLARYVTFVSVCPEHELGLGTPRPPMELRGSGRTTRLVVIETQHDLTVRFRAFAHDRLEALPPLDGYVFKARSPSCGLIGVTRVSHGTAAADGVGLFAAAFTRAHPLVPLAQESELADERCRDHFLERVFAHERARALLTGRPSTARLVAFHSRHAAQLRAHAPEKERALARLVGSQRHPASMQRARYVTRFLKALALPPLDREGAFPLELGAAERKLR